MSTPLEIKHHKVGDELNDGIKIQAMDAPGSGVAHHAYCFSWLCKDEDVRASMIYFQDGAVRDVGEVNGISIEALLAVAIHRLECFQAGPYSCRENALALTKLQESMHWLQARKRDRLNRGVEGQAKA